MKTYEAYKESGIEWIGRIPQDWLTVRLRYLCDIATGNKDTVNQTDDGIYPFYVRSKDVKKIGTFSYDGEAILTAGDGDICKIWHYVNEKFDFHQRVYMLYNFKNIDGKFLYYFISENFIHDVLKLSAKSTVDSLRLPMFLNFPLSIPKNIDEQTQIAKYLDHKTQIIDALIEKKEQLIKKLQAQRQAIINEAVTKGLNPNAKLKDSGIEWLGEIPEHWEVVKLKFLVSNKLKYGANESAEDENKEDPRYIRITDFGNDGNLKKNTFKSLPMDKAEEYLLKEGDILFARSGATVGKTFQFKNYNGLACFAGYLIKATVNHKILSDFLYYFTKSNIYENWKNSIFIQATIQNISAEKYNNLEITIPPTIREQQIIINHIKKKANNIDEIIKNSNVQIKKLKVYRQSIISEAVTGKIDVRDWQAKTT